MSHCGCRREVWLELYFQSTSLGGGTMWDPNSSFVAVSARSLWRFGSTLIASLVARGYGEDVPMV